MDKAGETILRLRAENAGLRVTLARLSNMLNFAVPHIADDPDDPCYPDCSRCALEKMYPRDKAN